MHADLVDVIGYGWVHGSDMNMGCWIVNTLAAGGKVGYQGDGTG